MEKLFFHGSPLQLSKLKSPDETGRIRRGEEARKELRDVVFFSENQDEAHNYAGREGYVYVCCVKNARKLEDIPANPFSKKQKRSATIWVAYPQDITIVRVIHPNGRVKNPFLERVLIG